LLFYFEGLFLGYAIVQAPGFLLTFFELTRNRIKTCSDARNIGVHNKTEPTPQSHPNTPGPSQYKDPFKSVQNNADSIECLKNEIVAMKKENSSMMAKVKDIKKELRTNKEMQEDTTAIC
jgi:hypothetical protein